QAAHPEERQPCEARVGLAPQDVPAQARPRRQERLASPPASLPPRGVSPLAGQGSRNRARVGRSVHPIANVLTRRPGMTARLIALLLLAILVTLAPPAPAGAQAVGDVFRRVSPSVVVIRSRGRDVAESGQVRFGEIGSGVLISADGKIMTAAHVVQAMDEIHVEFIGGETVPARVVASEPAADLSLLQLDRVPAGVK